MDVSLWQNIALSGFFRVRICGARAARRRLQPQKSDPMHDARAFERSCTSCWLSEQNNSKKNLKQTSKFSFAHQQFLDATGIYSSVTSSWPVMSLGAIVVALIAIAAFSAQLALHKIQEGMWARIFPQFLQRTMYTPTLLGCG